MSFNYDHYLLSFQIRTCTSVVYKKKTTVYLYKISQEKKKHCRSLKKNKENICKILVLKIIV